MFIKPIFQQYQRALSQPYWPAFLDMLSVDNRNRPVTLRLLDESGDELKVLNPPPLYSVNYERTATGSQVNIVLGQQSAIYFHIVSDPKQIGVFYEPNGQIFAVSITVDDGRQTIIDFEDDALVFCGRPEPLLSVLSERMSERAVAVCI